VRQHRVPQALDVQRAAAQVDVAAVGRAAELDHLGAQPPEQFRRQPEGRAVAAIDGHFHAVEAHRGSPQQVLEVLPVQVLIHAICAGAGATPRSSSRKISCSMGALRVRQFEAAVGENLDAVVLVRIVRGRDHHAGHERPGARQVGDARSGDHAGIAHARAAGWPAAGHQFRDPRAALARVGADQDLRVGGPWRRPPSATPKA
jgi:hypothetical protein